MKETLLITGGSGLLALDWARTMRHRYAVLLALHRREVSLAGVETRSLRLDSEHAISAVLDQVRPTLFVHAAGMTNVEQCEADPAGAQIVNVELTHHVARACARAGIPLVYISTDHLFAGDTPMVDEREPRSPRNVYARTKGEAESRLLEAWPQALVVRTNFYGWGPSYRRSFSDSIISALRTAETVTLFEDVFYTPILMEALVEAVHDLVNLKAGGIYNVVGDERVSKYEFGLRLAEQFRLDAGLIGKGRIANHLSLVPRPSDMSLSNVKTRNLLGRNLGGVDEHVARLYQQEQSGLAREIQNL